MSKGMGVHMQPESVEQTLWHSLLSLQASGELCRSFWAYPSPWKNLFWYSTQCNRRACRKADRDSMTMSTPIVQQANTKKPAQHTTA